MSIRKTLIAPLALFCAIASGQELAPGSFIKNFAADQAAIWTSPKHAGSNLLWLAPLALGTGALIATDHRTASWVPAGAIAPSSHVSRLGVGYMLIAPAALIAQGVIKHDRKAEGTGVLAFEALADAELLVTGVKYVTMRQRPPAGGAFWSPNGDPSFPSGHSAGVWAVSSVIASQYHSRTVRWLAYGGAVAVSGARYGAQRHHLSDILVGSAMGWLVGHYVYRNHPIQ